MTSTQPERLEKASEPARCLLALLVGLLASLALIVSGAGPASAQNAVGPQPQSLILAVGVQAAPAPNNVGPNGLPLRQSASATGVAADSGADDLAGATCGGESFTADTNVVMADGSTKPLDEVKVGDKVRATDPKTGKTSAQTVTQVWVNHDSDLMNVTVKSGGTTSIVQATQHHLFWDATRRTWVEADRLATGDRLRTDHGSLATVVSTVVVAGAADMWDLTVANDHDFYVVTITANLLVHNCPSGDGTSRGSTGRTEPANLNEQLAMQQAQADPAAGRVLTNITMNDSRWPASEGWVKMQQNVNGSIIHYVYNTTTGAADDFKYAGG